MRFAAGLVLALVLSSGQAGAQLDCSGGCTTTKYGFGTNPDFRIGEDPPDFFKFDHADFGENLGGISYYYNRGDFLGDANFCGAERVFNPLPGQVHLREQDACTPSATAIGPVCAGGANNGKSCHLGAAASFAATECPGGTCQESPGTSCRVEIPISDGGKTAPADTSEYHILTLTGGVLFGATWNISAQTANTLGGTSAAKECAGGPTPRAPCTVNGDCGTGGTCVDCFLPNTRQKPSMGTRYTLPEARRTELGLPAGATYIRWDAGFPAPQTGQPDQRIANSTAFRLHQDDAAVCCNSVATNVCPIILPGSVNYPIYFRPACTTSTGTERLINEDNITPDWIFEGGKVTRFFSDPNYQLPGEQHGVCLNNRETPCTRPGAYNNAACTGNRAPFVCCTGSGTGNCGTECPGGDTCDFRERGVRIQVRCIRDANSNPRADCCGSALAVIRGTPSAGCTMNPRYPVDGDAGSDCYTFNYGVDRRVDSNCDGTADVPSDDDLCPFLTEWDEDKDSDGDCAGGADADCRGDECECGDANLDGKVDVQDLVSINNMIFGSIVRQRLSDANSDLVTNVSDIVGANTEIFRPDSATCRHITSIRCGNNALDQGEACDNGANCVGGPTPGALCDASGANTCGSGGTCQRIGGDGCNTACRVEFGFTCTGSPSVCTPNP